MFLGSVAWNTRIGLVNPWVASWNHVQMFTPTVMCPCFHHILRLPSVLHHCFRHPSAVVPDVVCWVDPYPFRGVEQEPECKDGLLSPSVLPLCLRPRHPCLPPPESLSPRNSGVDNSASHHGDGCLIWDECYITHCTGPPLIRQHLLLLSACTADISAPNASWSRCLLDAVRDYLLGKQMIFCLMSK